MLEQEAGRDGPDGRAAAGDAGPHRDGLGPLLGREDVGEDRQRGGHDEGGGQAHERPGADDHGRGVGGGGQAGADQEQEQPGLQGALAAEPVTEGAGREEHPGEDQRVGVDHPLQVRRAGVEVEGEPWAGRR